MPQQYQIHDTTVLDGWAGTVYCHYNARKTQTIQQCYELNIEMCVSRRRKYQYLAIISIRGAWGCAQMDLAFIGRPYLSDVFLWSVYLRNRQAVITRFKMTHHFWIFLDYLCRGSIFWERIVLSKWSRLNTIKSSCHFIRLFWWKCYQTWFSMNNDGGSQDFLRHIVWIDSSTIIAKSIPASSSRIVGF